MPRPVPDYDPERDPEYGEALQRYLAANPDSPAAAEVRAEEAIAQGRRPVDLAGIRVRPDPSRAQQIDRAVARGEDLTPFLTQPGARAAPAKIAPTPEGEAMYADLLAAAREKAPSLLDRVSDAADEDPDAPGEMGAGEAAAHGFADTALAGWHDELQAISDKIEDIRNPLPEAELPLPGEAPAAALPAAPPTPPARPAPRVQVGYAVDVDEPNTAVVQSAAPPVPSGDIPAGTPLPAKAPPDPVAAARKLLGREDPLAQAQQAANANRLIAGLTRAGGAAIGRGSSPGYDALDRNADVPMEQFAQRQGEDARMKAEALASEGRDPKSPRSRAFQGLLMEMLKGAGAPPPAGLEGMSADQVQALFGPSEKLASLASSRAEKEAARGAAAEQKALDREARKDTARIVSAGMGETRRMAAEDRREKLQEGYVQKLDKSTVGFGDMATDLDTVLRGAQAEDVEGVGPGAGLLPDVLTSSAGTENRRAARRLVENLLKAQSGLAASDREQVRKLQSTSLADRASDADWRAGAGELARFVKKAMRSREAAFPREAVETYGSRGGVTSADIPTSAPGPSRASGPVQISSVEEYNALPPGTAYVDPKGRPKVKR